MFVPKRMFLTKGVGKHREKLTSFELARARDHNRALRISCSKSDGELAIANRNRLEIHIVA